MADPRHELVAQARRHVLTAWALLELADNLSESVTGWDSSERQAEAAAIANRSADAEQLLHELAELMQRFPGLRKPKGATGG